MSRYSRQERFLAIGTNGQTLLADKHVLIIGVGALGATIADLLVRAGVGEISLVDRDFVDLSNLQRQMLYSEADVTARLPKATAAKRRLQEINHTTIIHAYNEEANVEFFEHMLTTHSIDLMIDGTDHFDIRFVMNDIAHKYSIPWIYGACVAASSLSFFIKPGKTTCLHCIMGDLPSTGPTCDTAGILASASQITAALQVAEALKYLTDNEAAMRGTVFSIDVWQNTFSSVNVEALRKPTCPTCGEKPTYPFLQPNATTKFASLCGRDTVQIRPVYKMRDLLALKEQLQAEKISHFNDFLISFHAQEYQLTAFKDGRVFVHGTADIQQAKSIYYQYFT
ncbi:ThiF family adenylyltransferase [Metasolibacillus meyeri]|uniref:ThiF family adenylyltransferase n=1 Tax=Metasolibacillus meyeri TaxID=1071052 RepID=UPI000D30C686|nr:ThiF family adenylyltransferase [Metasolibacillus meyeri]